MRNKHKSLKHLSPQTQDSSHSSPDPECGTSHRGQFSTNLSNVNPSHREQSFRNRVLQRGSPMGSQALPANVLQHGLLSPRVHRSWQEPAPARGSPRCHSLLQMHYLLRRGILHRLQVDICSTVDLCGLQRDNLPHHGLLCGLQENVCYGTWSASSPSFFIDLGVCIAVSLTYSHFFFQLLFLLHRFSPLLK